MGRPRKKAESPAPETAPEPAPPTREAVPAAPPPDAGDEPLRLEWRDPAELAENPANWRVHPREQIAALSDVIAEVGWAGVCLFNESTGRLIDGHARRKVALDQGCRKVPVLVGRWTEEQERKILATLDPLAGMAEADPAKIAALVSEIETESEAVRLLLQSLAPEQAGGAAADGAGAAGEDEIPEQFQVLVVCDTERQQAELLERLTAEGLKCKSLIS